MAGTLETLPSSTHNEWRSAAEVDTWGLTWIAARKGDEPWKQFQALDLVRGGARGKPFWHAEAQGGPLWMQPQVINRPREDGRIPDAEDVRLWNLISCAGGARGILYLPLAASSGRPLVRSLCSLRHGRLGDPASGDGQPGGAMG